MKEESQDELAVERKVSKMARTDLERAQQELKLKDEQLQKIREDAKKSASAGVKQTDNALTAVGLTAAPTAARIPAALHDKVKAENERLEKQNAELLANERKSVSEMQKKEQEIGLLKQELQAAKQKAEQVKTESTKAVHVAKFSQQREIEELTQRIEALQQAKARVEEAKVRVELQEKLTEQTAHDKQKEADNLQRQIQAMQDELAAAQEHTKAVEESANVKLMLVDHLQSARGDAQAEAENLRVEVKALREKEERARRAEEKTKEELHHTRESLQRLNYGYDQLQELHSTLKQDYEKMVTFLPTPTLNNKGAEESSSTNNAKTDPEGMEEAVFIATMELHDMLDQKDSEITRLTEVVEDLNARLKMLRAQIREWGETPDDLPPKPKS